MKQLIFVILFVTTTYFLNAQQSNKAKLFASFLSKLPELTENTTYKVNASLDAPTYKVSKEEFELFKPNYVYMLYPFGTTGLVLGYSKHCDSLFSIVTIGYVNDSIHDTPRLFLFNKKGVIIRETPLGDSFNFSKKIITQALTITIPPIKTKPGKTILKEIKIKLDPLGYVFYNSKDYQINLLDNTSIIYPDKSVYKGRVNIVPEKMDNGSYDYVVKLSFASGTLTDKAGKVIEGNFCGDKLICKQGPKVFLDNMELKREEPLKVSKQKLLSVNEFSLVNDPTNPNEKYTITKIQYTGKVKNSIYGGPCKDRQICIEITEKIKDVQPNNRLSLDIEIQSALGYTYYLRREILFVE